MPATPKPGLPGGFFALGMWNSPSDAVTNRRLISTASIWLLRAALGASETRLMAAAYAHASNTTHRRNRRQPSRASAVTPYLQIASFMYCEQLGFDTACPWQGGRNHDKQRKAPPRLHRLQV
jgi:hypothetical protein